MNKTELFAILQKLDAISTYGELLPDDFKLRYSSDISSLKKKLTEAGNESQPVGQQAQPEVKPAENTLNISQAPDNITTRPEVTPPETEAVLVPLPKPAF